MEYTFEGLNELQQSLNSTNVISDEYRSFIMAWALAAVNEAHKAGIAEGKNQVQEEHAAILGDAQHPQTLDYIATNLLDALEQVPNTGDWHGIMRRWAEKNSTGELKPNRSA